MVNYLESYDAEYQKLVLEMLEHPETSRALKKQLVKLRNIEKPGEWCENCKRVYFDDWSTKWCLKVGIHLTHYRKKKVCDLFDDGIPNEPVEKVVLTDDDLEADLWPSRELVIA